MSDTPDRLPLRLLATQAELLLARNLVETRLALRRAIEVQIDSLRAQTEALTREQP